MIYIISSIHSGPSDYGSVSTQLEFDQNNPRQCVEIAIVNDTTIEDTEVFFVSLMSAEGDVQITTGNATVRIADNSGKLLSETVSHEIYLFQFICESVYGSV